MTFRELTPRVAGTCGGLLASGVAVAVLALGGMSGAAGASRSVHGSSSRSADLASVPLQALTWRNIGPVRAGRSIAAAGSPSRPNEYYAGATGGGLWKTTDGGTTWNPVSDPYFKSSSVGAVAVCQANPDVVYAGMGEGDLRNDILQGDGVYKSTDAGKTWTHMGLSDTRAISRIVVDPTDCSRVFVGALGHPYHGNTQRGVFRSTDGGRTWQRVLYVNSGTGVSALSMDAQNPQIIYAGLWHTSMTPWGGSDGGPGDGIYKSTDGGTTWTNLTHNPGLPQGVIGKIGVAVSPVNPSRVYSLISAPAARRDWGLYVSDDAGATWRHVNGDSELGERPRYGLHVFADPQQANTVYVMTDVFLKSTDGGKTFTTSFRPPHTKDEHDLWIDPTNVQRMIVANDGGATITTNGGATWTPQNYPTAQIYHVMTTNDVPYLVCGSQQDAGSTCVSSQGNGQILFSPGGGESGYIASPPNDSNVFYAGSLGGGLTRYDRRVPFDTRAIDVWPVIPFGQAPLNIKERFQWTFPIATTPADPKPVYVSSQHVFRSTNGGQSWTRISPDLTRDDPTTLGRPFGPVYKEGSSAETYGTVFALAPSPINRKVIWAGSDDGLVHLTRDGGRTWQNVTPPGVLPFTRISIIDASSQDPGTAYVAANRYQLDDRAPYIYKTHDYGRTWTPIVTGIASDDYVHSVREDPVRPGLLYAGTEHGVYVSFDDGAHWQSLSENLPDTSVQDLTVKGNDLVIATHGRGFYIMDDISPLRQITPQVASDPAHLYQPSPTRMSVDSGVTVTYALRDRVAHASVAFLDSHGHRVGAVANAPAGAGMHRLVWKPPSHDATFTVRLTAGGRSESRNANVVPGPARTVLPTAPAAPSAAAAPKASAQSDQSFQLFKPANAVSLVDRNLTVSYSLSKPASSATLTFLDSKGNTIRSFTGTDVPTTTGMHQFLWDMRYPGPVLFDGELILFANPQQGPRAPWGSYSVRLTVDGQSQTEPFNIEGASTLRGVTQHDTVEEFNLGMGIVKRTSAASEGVIASRACRAQIDNRIQQANSPDVTSDGQNLDSRLLRIENALYQSKLLFSPLAGSDAGDDPGHFPLKLVNKMISLLPTVDRADSQPTNQDNAVFNVLSGRIGQQLANLDAVFGQPVAEFNARLKQHNLQPISCSR